MHRDRESESEEEYVEFIGDDVAEDEKEANSNETLQ